MNGLDALVSGLAARGRSGASLPGRPWFQELLMPFIRLSRVSFSYTSSSVDVFSAVDLEIHPGWTGVVGANGGGKTTLLRVIAGELAPTTGAVTLGAAVPAGASIHVCAQRVDAVSPAITAFAGDWSRAACRLRSRLVLDPDDMARWPTLSPGERKRWQIGAALAASPDILILDEPSNHLDARARALLVASLSRFRGVGLVVSHDRVLLEELTAQTIRVHHGRVASYRGPYSKAREQWQSEERGVRQAHDQARKEQKALRRRLADERRKRERAEGTISAGSRMKSKKDSDARSLNAKGRAMNAEARLSRKVGLLRDASERAEARVAGFDMVKERGRSLFVDYQPSPKRFVMALEGRSVQAGERALLRDVRVAVERDSRIHLAGDNGTGKTTLLGALLESATIPRERILHVPQVLSLDDRAEILDDIVNAPPAERGRILQVAAALGLDPERVLATASPSPGEIRKLAIARGLGQGAWLVVLDEPTNHLDLPSIERLEAALAAYPGAIVLVSHDPSFAGAITSQVWQLGDGRVRV